MTKTTTRHDGSTRGGSTQGSGGVSRKLMGSALAAILLATSSVTSWAQESPARAGASSVVVQAVDARAEAVRAIKQGEFDRGTDLLARFAQAGTADPQLVRLAKWASEYESQRQVFVTERRKQFEKSVEDVRKLVEAKADEFALDYATRAYVLAEDKQRFTDSELMRGLVSRTTELAGKYEGREQWVKALRLYSDLTQIEPTEPKWKEKLKQSTRRLRILALYNPDALKKLREEDAKLLEELEKIIPPTTTRPATRPASVAGDEADPAFKTDWRDNLRGIKADMLWQSLINVRSNYWREVSFSDMIQGGLRGVRSAVETDGIAPVFPGLADAAKREAMVAQIDQLSKQLAAAPKGSEVWESSRVFKKLLEANRQTVGLPEEVIVYEFADASLAECDPFTSMIWPYDVDEFAKSTQGEFSGVGISINSDDDGSLRVVSPMEDSPAFKSGIKAGDVISHVNGKSVKGITTQQAVKVITGPSGTKVTLTIRSFDGAVKDHVLTRETIKVASIKGFTHRPGGGWDYMIDPENKIAYLRLTNFTKSSGEELETATNELKELGARGIILDLRYNPGGLLSAAIDVANRFLGEGVIVSTRPDRQTPQQPTVTPARPDPDDVKLPMVVLVNQYSASASEIVSGALKDQGRAVVVGERSYGKGSVQMLFRVDSGPAMLKLTTSHYYLPSGRCLHREENSTTWGVDPDVKVEMTPEQMANSQRARTDLDILRVQGETPAPSATSRPDGRPIARTSEDLLKSDNQLGAALLLLRLQLNGVEVATGTPAPGVNKEATR